MKIILKELILKCRGLRIKLNSSGIKTDGNLMTGYIASFNKSVPKSFVETGAGDSRQFPGREAKSGWNISSGISSVIILRARGVSSIFTFAEYSSKANALHSDVYRQGVSLWFQRPPFSLAPSPVMSYACFDFPMRYTIIVAH